jgi:ATP-grasp ribosomal peptide maturase
MDGKMILILTQELDVHADAVIRELDRRHVPVTRLHTADFPQAVTLTARCRERWSTTVRTDHRELRLEEVTSVWYRRPAQFKLSPALTTGERRFVLTESRMAFGGLFESMDCLWVDHPSRLTAANYKPYQLQLAAQCGLSIPRSLITNDPNAFQAFCRECDDRVIFKSLGVGAIDESGPDGLRPIFTSLIDPATIGDLAPRVRHAACLFQEYVDKRVELRVVVVGSQVFAVAMYSQATETGRIDYRLALNSNMRHELFELPPDVAEQCVAVVRRLGLFFGALDLIVTPHDEIVFLEVNAAGQWLWLEDEAGVAIKEALTDLLVAGAPAPRDERLQLSVNTVSNGRDADDGA